MALREAALSPVQRRILARAEKSSEVSPKPCLLSAALDGMEKSSLAAGVVHVRPRTRVCPLASWSRTDCRVGVLQTKGGIRNSLPLPPGTRRK